MNAFEGVGLEITGKQAVQSMVLELYVSDEVVPHIFDAAAATRTAEIIVRNLVAIQSVKRLNTENKFQTMVKAVDDTRPPLSGDGLSRSAILPENITDDGRILAQVCCSFRVVKDR